jgi:DMSO/TMAO reductase YedYZ molybdopterin-dependent catalytic subunit
MPYTLRVLRRTFLHHAITWGGVTFLGGTQRMAEALAAQSCRDTPVGDLLGLVPLHGAAPRSTPFGAIVGGDGLDARKFTDLSTLGPGALVTATRDVFLRTTAPALVRERLSRWPLSVEALLKNARSMGAHLIECSGNVDPDNFGLMSVAEWSGVPLIEYIEGAIHGAGPGTEARKRADQPALFVGGLDYPSSSRTSAAGASWVFSLDDVRNTGAFLATQMNGESLPVDHGAPVRLVVPGWYGCSWIKWVDDIRYAGADEPVTSQMIEFSLRTHQPAIPKRALDYEPPVIDVAATPIRVEKRRVDGRLVYRVIGIVWGGQRPVDRLMIRFRAGEAPTPFTLCPPPQSHRTWSLWEYRWQPAEPGVYTIGLTAADPAIRTRRLDVSFYVRRVVIDEI